MKSVAKAFVPMDLTTLFLSISSAAYMGMGISDEVGVLGASSARVDLSLVRQNIDFLELMHEKTHGNRNVDEDRLLQQLLSDVRLKYLELQKKMAVSSSVG